MIYAEVLQKMEFKKLVDIASSLTGIDLFSESGVNLKNVYFDTSSSKRIQGSDIQQTIDVFGYEHIYSLNANNILALGK